VGIDETSLRRGQHYITVVHDLDAKRLLFATEGRDHRTVVAFARDLKAHGGDPAEVRHVSMDMSAAYAKGVAMALAEAQISYDLRPLPRRLDGHRGNGRSAPRRDDRRRAGCEGGARG
jgi:transposase